MMHEINGKTMEPDGDPFKFIMEIDRLAADLHRLGDKSVTDPRKCVIIVAGLSADYEMECRMFENNLDGLNRAEIERVIGNQYNIRLRRQKDSRLCRRRRSASRRIAARGRIGDPVRNSRATVTDAERKVIALRIARAQ